MKKCLMTLGMLVLVAMAQADTGFLKTLPADEFATAGLQKLTPEELARLEALVQRYKTGEVAEVRQEAEAKAAASRQEAEKRIVEAETKAKEAESKANEAALKAREAETKTATAPGKKQPGWFKALLTLSRASEKPEKEEPLESRLVGDFDGWDGRTVFSLENGTRWKQQNKTETYPYSPVLHSPKVKIRPAAFTGFWMQIEGVNLQVRVIPLALPEQKQEK
jgi:hypothetical protein